VKPSPRRKARELAVQAVYSWQISQNPVNEIEVNFIADNSKRRFDIEYFQQLLRGVTNSVAELDLAISPHVDRPLDDIDHVEKAILRVAVFELSECQDVPYRVVINEAIELAKSFAADDSHKFVNGVLDKAVKLIISDCYKQATHILKENIDSLHLMAQSLVEYETLDSEQIDDIMAGAKPRAPGSKENKTESKKKNDPSVGDTAEQS